MSCILIVKKIHLFLREEICFPKAPEGREQNTREYSSFSILCIHYNNVAQSYCLQR